MKSVNQCELIFGVIKTSTSKMSIIQRMHIAVVVTKDHHSLEKPFTGITYMTPSRSHSSGGVAVLLILSFNSPVKR